MKVFFRGYNPVSGDIGHHCCVCDSFRSFDYDCVKDVNLTYSFCVLVTERKVYITNFCEHYPEKQRSLDLCAEKNIVQASGCSNRVVLLSEDGELFKVVISNGNTNVRYSLEPITKLLHSTADKIVKIACNSRINIALSKEGRLFSIPNEIDRHGIDVADVAVGREHCVVLDKNGNVYTFGSGRYY